MVRGKSPIMPMTWAAHGQTPSDASEEVPMVTQLDEERQRLWELAKANLEKAHKRYKDFSDKSRREVKFQVGDEVCRNPTLGLSVRMQLTPKDGKMEFSGTLENSEDNLRGQISSP